MKQIDLSSKNLKQMIKFRMSEKIGGNRRYWLAEEFDRIYDGELNGDAFGFPDMSKRLFNRFLSDYDSNGERTSVIDIGCGTGEKGLYFYENLNSQNRGDLIFVDKEKACLSHAKRIAKGRGISSESLEYNIKELYGADFFDIEGRKLFLLLGGTVGNMPIEYSVGPISMHVNPTDILLVEGDLVKRPRDYLESVDFLRRHPFCNELGKSVDVIIDDSWNYKKDTQLILGIAKLLEDRPEYGLNENDELVIGVSCSIPTHYVRDKIALYQLKIKREFTEVEDKRVRVLYEIGH